MWCRAVALALFCTLAASHAAAQTDNDAAFERLESINSLWLGRLHVPLTFALVDVGRLDVDGAIGAGFTVLGLEKRGAAWEALRLDRLQGWIDSGFFDIAFTAIDLQQAMIGTDLDHDLCVAAIPVMLLGDCRQGGTFGVHAQLFHHAYTSDNARWFHRWFEVGAVWNPVGDSFDVDFVQSRLPITLGVSLDQVANVPPLPGEASVRLRGFAEVALVHRFGGFRWELTSAVAFRPALAPFEVADDYALEGRLRISYVWLSALLGSLRGTAQRVYLEVRASHWEEPWLSEQPWLGQNSLQFMLGMELRLRDLTPS